MGTNVKTLGFPWWLQLSKRQILSFLPRLSFGTVRSEVRILSPRPVIHRFESHVTHSQTLFPQKEGDLHETRNTNDTATDILRRDLDRNGCALTASRRPEYNSNTTSGAHTGISLYHGG